MGSVVWVLLLVGAGALWTTLVYLMARGIEDGKEASSLRPVWLVLLTEKEAGWTHVQDQDLGTPTAHRRTAA